MTFYFKKYAGIPCQGNMIYYAKQFCRFSFQMGMKIKGKSEQFRSDRRYYKPSDKYNSSKL